MASDSLESLGQKLIQGNNVFISVHPDSKEEADRIFTSLSAGGTIEMPIADQPWGDYYGHFKDKFGVMWMVNYLSLRAICLSNSSKVLSTTFMAVSPNFS